MRSFDITDPHVIPQWNKIAKLLYKHTTKVRLAYHSNWYLVIACLNHGDAQQMLHKLSKLGPWDIELCMGLKNKYHYIKLKFNQSS